MQGQKIFRTAVVETASGVQSVQLHHEGKNEGVGVDLCTFLCYHNRILSKDEKDKDNLSEKESLTEAREHRMERKEIMNMDREQQKHQKEEQTLAMQVEEILQMEDTAENRKMEQDARRNSKNTSRRKAGRKDTGIKMRRLTRLTGREWAQLLFLPLMLIFDEVIFHILTFQQLGKNLIYPILFAAAIGMGASLLVSAFPAKVNRILAGVFTFLGFLWFSVQIVYHSIFKTFLSIYSIGENGEDVMEFYKQALRAIVSELFPILLFLAPFVLLLVLQKKKIFRFQPLNYRLLGAEAAGAVLLYALTLLTLLAQGKNDYSPYDLYYDNFVMDLSVEKLGILTSTRKDIIHVVTGKSGSGLDDIIFIGLPGETTPTPAVTPTSEPAEPTQPPAPTDAEPTGTPTPSPSPTPTPIDTSPNVLNIDFNALAEAESDKTIQKLHNYFASAAPTNKNEYTGMFEGYNLIMLTAEGYSQWAVNEEITPTLYKMVHEGFYFENYYTPLWWTSTSDGEFVECTGLIPTGTNSFTKTADNYMPFGFGWVFSKLGYSARAYHNHSYTYYHRDQTHPNMGYDYKGAKGGGLDVKLTWPESDLEMMEKTVPEFINDEQFHVYYMTVSGHMEYNFIGNSMSAKNREYVSHLDMSDEAKAYLACQKELDFALEYLLEQLEEAGVADKTVIVLSGDHYPYGLEKDKIDELAGHEVEENFELYKSNLVLYCPGMEPITIEEPCSALDIVPTVLNLFGIDYDSRLFMGQDILSAATPLVMFSNQSYITDKVMYNSKNGEVTPLTEEELPEDYTKTVSAIVRNKFNISAAIITDDYYSYLREYLE